MKNLGPVRAEDLLEADDIDLAYEVSGEWRIFMHSFIAEFEFKKNIFFL